MWVGKVQGYIIKAKLSLIRDVAPFLNRLADAATLDRLGFNITSTTCSNPRWGPVFQKFWDVLMNTVSCFQ